MSRVETLDLAALRARLLAALDGKLDGSLYLQAIGACLLACSPESPWELGCWDSLFQAQARAEAVEAELLLDVLGSQVTS